MLRALKILILILITTNLSALEIPKNERIDHWVDYFKGKKFFQYAINRSVLYRLEIVSVFKDRGLPVELSWLPLIESVFDCSALSEAKAAGCWQFMKETGKDFGLHSDPWRDNRYNFKLSTYAAATYLDNLHKKFGRWDLALAAYNWGPTRLKRKIKKEGNDFWSLKLNKETMNYVPKFYATIIIVKNLEKYGFKEPKSNYMTVKLKKGQHNLKYIAKLLGVEYEKFYQLNPGFKVGFTSPNKETTLFLKKNWNYRILGSFGLLRD